MGEGSRPRETPFSGKEHIDYHGKEVKSALWILFCMGKHALGIHYFLKGIFCSGSTRRGK